MGHQIFKIGHSKPTEEQIKEHLTLCPLKDCPYNTKPKEVKHVLDRFTGYRAY